MATPFLTLSFYLCFSIFCHSLFFLPSWKERGTAPGHTTSLTCSRGGRVGKWGTWEFLYSLSFSSVSSTSDITSSDAHLSSKHSLKTTLMDMNKFVLVEVVCMCQRITNNVTGNNFCSSEGVTSSPLLETFAAYCLLLMNRAFYHLLTQISLFPNVLYSDTDNSLISMLSKPHC